jgi:hypothetical protein
MKRTPSRPILGFLLFGAVLAVSSSTALGQSCSFNTVPQGRVCSKETARCSPPTVGGGNVGKCTTETGQANTLVCECQGAPTPSYNMILSPLTPPALSAGVATSTITVIPFNGFTGEVDFACTISGMGHPAPSCATPAPATVTGPGSARSSLTVSASSSTGEAAFTVTVNAVDAHGRPPDNGAQTSTVLVSHSPLIIGTNGNNIDGPKIALITFLVLLTLWVLVYLVRTRRPTSR